MRLRTLRLIAFGPFTDVDIELGDAPALHVLYGPNEAGKSTALRAITGLLYGIPVRTSDDHLHKKDELRVGAMLIQNGSSLSVVRRKGNVRTLLDSDGHAMSEAALGAMLGGVDEATFRVMFGLDHVGLREGAEALLRGGGSIGESLFDAGLGGRGIHQVLQELRREADELYRPRGQRQAVNDALRRFKEAKERRASESVRPDAWVLQVEHLDRARADHQAASARRRQLKIEESALQRARHVIPLLAQRNALLGRRAEVGDVPLLPHQSVERRIELQRLLGEGARDVQRLEGEIAELAAQLEALDVSESLVALDADAVEAVPTRLGEYGKALLDLPKRSAELKAREAEVARLAAAVGLTGDAADLERARFGVRAQAAVRSLAQRRTALDATAVHIRLRLEQSRAELGELRERESRLSEPPDDSGLRAAIDEARLVADLPVRIEELDAEIAALRQALADGVRRLAPWRGEPAELARVGLPSAETIDRFAREMDRHAALRADIERRRRELQDRAAVNESDRLAVEAMGAPPGQSDLLASRALRDEAWQRIAAGSIPPADAASDFERALRAADDIADRLYREADRVAAAARLRADAERLQRQLAEVDGDAAAAARAAEELAERWRDVWREVGFAPAEPPEMRDWLARSAGVLRDTERLRERIDERRRLAERVAERDAALSAALRAAGAEVYGESTSELQRSARELCEAWSAVRRRRDELARAGEALESEVSRDSRALEQLEEQIAAWLQDWGRAVAPLGLDIGVSTEEANAVLDGLKALAARMEDTDAMRARVAAIEADIEAFRADVARIIAAGAPHLAGVDAAESAQRLVREHRRVMDDVRAQRRVDSEIETRRGRLRSLAEQRRVAEDELQSLFAAARASDLQSLEAAERRSDEAQSLDSEIARIEEELFTKGEGAAIDVLIEQTRGIDGDGAKARLFEIENETQELTEEIERLRQEIGQLEEGLARLENERGAANAAAEEQEALADLSAQVRRYVCVTLAAEILDSEVERYRQQNQGPILSRANAFFPRLTVGNYRELRVGYDSKDAEVLRCVRSDETEVDIERLSDGTRDQLYLALRLATVQHFAASRESLPLVLDDIFIHFDDERTEAALRVLGDFASTTQILLFTHHAHVLDLARKVVPDDRRIEHDLSILRGRRRRAEKPSAGGEDAALAAGES